MSSTFKRAQQRRNTNQTLSSSSTSTAIDVDIGASTYSGDGTENNNTTVDTATTTTNIITSNRLSVLKGTKFWTNGTILVSTGLRELDNILFSSSSSGTGNTSLLESSGNSDKNKNNNSSTNSSIGGQPIGSCICLLSNDDDHERVNSSISILQSSSGVTTNNTIVRYWITEGICQEQVVIIPVFDDYVMSQTDQWNLLCQPSSWIPTDDNTTDPIDFNNDSTNTNLQQQQQQRYNEVFVATTESIHNHLLHSLPRNMNIDKQNWKEKIKKLSLVSGRSTTNTGVSGIDIGNHTPSTTADTDDASTIVPPLQQHQSLLETLAEAEEENEDEYDSGENNATNDECLVVAWQYRTDVQQERLGLSTITTSNNSSNETTSSSASSNTSTTSSTNRAGSSRFRTNTKSKTKTPIYCHSYNLQGRLCDQMNLQKDIFINSYVTIVPIKYGNTDISVEESSNITSNTCSHRSRNGVQFYQQLVASINTEYTKRDSNVVIRLLLYHPINSLCAFVLPLILHYIRTKKLPVVVLVAPNTFLQNKSDVNNNKKDLIAIRRCSDVVMSTESFIMQDNYPPPKEYQHLDGLLHIQRLSTMTQMCTQGHFAERTIQRSSIAMRYGYYYDSRKLYITLLHIPPEDYTTNNNSNVAATTSSSATVGSALNATERSGDGRHRNSTVAAAIGGCASAIDF